MSFFEGRLFKVIYVLSFFGFFLLWMLPPLPKVMVVPAVVPEEWKPIPTASQEEPPSSSQVSKNEPTDGDVLVAEDMALVVGGNLPAYDGKLLFEEDFESSRRMRNLLEDPAWQDGTQARGTSSFLFVGKGNYLDSRVLDGRSSFGQGGENVALYKVPIRPEKRTTLVFRAYATTDEPVSHNSAVSIMSLSREGAKYAGVWFPDMNEGQGVWVFAAGGEKTLVRGGFDKPVELGIVIDGREERVWGFYDFGEGRRETEKRYLDWASVVDLNATRIYAVRIYVDRRSGGAYSGIEIDDLRIFEK